MKKVDVWKDVVAPLEMYEDNRGKIADIFYNENINHVAIISSKGGVRRGDHYHRQTTQHVLVIEGSMVYIYQPYDKSDKVKYVFVGKGEMVSTPPFEIHTLLFPKDNKFVVFSSGLRGGKDYEKDTFRVDPLELPKEISHLESHNASLKREKHELK